MARFPALVALVAIVVSACGDERSLDQLAAEAEKAAAGIAQQQASSDPQTNSALGSKAEHQNSSLTQTARTDASARTNPDAVYCPAGSWYSPTEKLCVTSTQAIGPFTRAMISLCKKYGGGESACESSRWERQFAARVRLSETCPRGAQFDSSRQACVEGQEVHGPFKNRDVESCRNRGGGNTCETMRWNVSFLPQLVNGGTANRKLLSYYGVRSNYDVVFSDVLAFYPAGRRNGCVAFMSSALRRSGTPVPISTLINGESVSLVTKPFAQYLQERLGWVKITSANNLQPGDVVLTEDDARYPGYPAHTYMFYGWSNQRGGIGWVIDNQDFIHERNIFGYGTYNFTPFAYALRSPE